MPLRDVPSRDKAPGAGILPFAASTGRVLLGERSHYCADPYTWAGFGGSAEPEDRSPVDTALREFVEETGYHGPVDLVASGVVRRGPTVSHVFVGIVPVEFEPTLNDEHIMALWLEPMTLNPAALHWTAREFLRVLPSPYLTDLGRRRRTPRSSF
jgi:8-oxo-dGTP pyrophosphatase MutT (NUDIX family)